jgi:nucleoside-diphosphate-sugar epimerase
LGNHRRRGNSREIFLKIFITGSTGFIGGNLARKLADSGCRVHALCRSSQKANLIKHKNIKIFKGNILDKMSLELAMEGCSQMYHLGACTKVLVQKQDLYYKVNVLGTINVLEAALKLGIEKIVVTSTAGVLCPSTRGAKDETSNSPTDFFTEYDHSKYLMEKKIEEYVKKGLHIVLVNPTRVYGPGLLSQANSATQLIKMYLQGKWRIIPEDGSRICNYVFIDDVVNGHILAMEKGKAGERYILGGNNISYSNFFQTLANISNKKYIMFKFSKPLLMGISRVIVLFAKISGSPPLITPQYVRKYLQDWKVSSEKAEKELGYAITPLEKGLERTIAWLNEMN